MKRKVIAALFTRNNEFMICRRPPHKARGGVCGVLPVALGDGSTIRLSGSLVMGYATSGSGCVETRTEPDYEIDYRYYFDDEYIDKFIESVKEN